MISKSIYNFSLRDARAIVFDKDSNPQDTIAAWCQIPRFTQATGLQAEYFGKLLGLVKKAQRLNLALSQGKIVFTGFYVEPTLAYLHLIEDSINLNKTAPQAVRQFWVHFTVCLPKNNFSQQIST